MATSIAILGLALIAAGILIRLVGCAIRMAIPANLLLVAIGVVWHLLGR